MPEILQEYDHNREMFESYAVALQSLLNTLVRDADISVHTLEYRVKNRKSLAAKIIKKGKYSSINDITDIVGVRIISHYASDVDRIASIVEKEFLIDAENSIDKRKSLEPDKFGYLSLHYIVSLNDKRTGLSEYGRYKNIKAEIQIRSILQHAWAEIEHDIGYKSNNGLPNVIRRHFSRLAGLLELADDEFVKIRQSINVIQGEVVSAIKQGKGDILLDVVSLAEFTEQSTIMAEIKNDLKIRYDIKVSETVSKTELPAILAVLAYLNISTVKELSGALKLHREDISQRLLALGPQFIQFYQYDVLSLEVILLFLTHVIIARMNSKESESKFWEIMGVNLSEYLQHDVFEKIRQELPPQNNQN